jgi:hypothetical protein
LTFLDIVIDCVIMSKELMTHKLRLANAIYVLTKELKWEHCPNKGDWMFRSPKGKLFDLSKANFQNIKDIEENGIFIIE